MCVCGGGGGMEKSLHREQKLMYILCGFDNLNSETFG